MSSSVKKQNTRWIHCNVCFEIFGRNKFFLMACEHIICSTCSKKYDYKYCPICKKKTAYQEICNTMEKSILEYFSDDVMHQLNVVLKKIDFQRKHKFSLHYKLLNLENELQKVIAVDEKIKFKEDYIDKKWNHYNKMEKELLKHINIIMKKKHDLLMMLEISSQQSCNTSSQSGFNYERNVSRQARRMRDSSFTGNLSKRHEYHCQLFSSPMDISIQSINCHSDNSVLKNKENYMREMKLNYSKSSNIEKNKNFINKLKKKDDSPYSVSINDMRSPSSYYTVKKKSTPNSLDSFLRNRNYNIS